MISFLRYVNQSRGKTNERFTATVGGASHGRGRERERRGGEWVQRGQGGGRQEGKERR